MKYRNMFSSVGFEIINLRDVFHREFVVRLKSLVKEYEPVLTHATKCNCNACKEYILQDQPILPLLSYDARRTYYKIYDFKHYLPKRLIKEIKKRHQRGVMRRFNAKKAMLEELKWSPQYIKRLMNEQDSEDVFEEYGY